MKKWLCAIACLFSLYVQAQVWTMKGKEPAGPGTWWCFRNTVTLDETPRSLELRLAADTKYWLWVNGELQLSEGGLKRGPNPSDTYCDVITSADAGQREPLRFLDLLHGYGRPSDDSRRTSTGKEIHSRMENRFLGIGRTPFRRMDLG